MIQFKIVVFIVSALAVGNVDAAFHWTRCKNAPHWTWANPPNSNMGCSGLIYDKDGYWDSKAKDGLFVSPTGYLRTTHDCNLVVVRSKAGVGSAWCKHYGGDCCLPNEAGTNIENIFAYYTGNS
nr:uncharacterized protein CTRU02_12743 [Colletotrichum truncatum]KAF6784214.1 hypothetical protein CTRU02_12743 [Colletotrichum truncatum]